MKVSELIDQLVSSDLKQTSLADIGTVETREYNPGQLSNLNTLVGFVNQGLLELYKRFHLRVEAIEVDADEYDKNLPVAVPDKVLSLLRVEDSLGEIIPLDDLETEWQYKNKVYKGMYVKTVAVNKFTVQGDYPRPGLELFFYCLMSPEIVKINSVIAIPASFQEPLINYIIYRGYSTVIAVSNVENRGLDYKKRYEDSCKELEKITNHLYDYIDYNRLSARGFV